MGSSWVAGRQQPHLPHGYTHLVEGGEEVTIVQTTGTPAPHRSYKMGLKFSKPASKRLQVPGEHL